MATVFHTPPPATPKPVAGPLKLAGQFTLGVLFLLSVLLLGWTVFDYATSRFVSADAARVEERKKILADRQAEDHKYLYDKPSWFKQDAGLVRVPIEQAMRMTIPALQAERPRAAYPITPANPVMDSGAPTSPDKGVGSVPGQNTNPPASNPTTGHPVPTPAPSATPAIPAPGQPGAAIAPTPASAAPAAPAPAAQPTATPAPSATAAPTAAPTPANNNSNPGSAPIPGTHAQPTPAQEATPAGFKIGGQHGTQQTPAPAPEVTATPTGAKPAPLATVPPQPTPTGTPPAGGGPAPTPTPGPKEPGANPAGTP